MLVAALVPRSRRIGIVVATAWVVLAAARFWLPLGGGLRGQYFAGEGLAGAPALNVVDPEISTAQVYARWRAAPPSAFAVQWSGYLRVPRSGQYRLTTTSDDGSRLFVDDKLVVENEGRPDNRAQLEADGQPAPSTRSGDLHLDEGAHKVVLQFEQKRGRYVIEWTWARAGSPPTRIPRWALSTTRDSARARAAFWIGRVWWIATGAGALLAAALAWSTFQERVKARFERRRLGRMTLVAGFAVVLGSFYYAGAVEHALAVNLSKARGDQSAWLWDAQRVYDNWHGRTPPMLIGQRLRMPLYAGYLALFYTPAMSDTEFFDAAKRWNIRLSLVLLGALAVVFFRRLPPLPAANLTLVLAFGYFIFKAGYTQPELLLYTLFFCAFLACCRLLRNHEAGWPAIAVGGLAGILAGLTHLTKAIMLPFLGIFFGFYAAREVILWSSGKRSARQVAGRAAVAAVMAACFLGVLYPYVVNTQRVFGSYFYHGTTSVLSWYDSTGAALAVVMPRLQPDGRIDLPREQLPTALTYWRTHSLAQIAGRLREGFTDIVVRSYTTYWYFKYVVLYLILAAAVVAANRGAFGDLLRRDAAVVAFLIVYAAVFLTFTAFFSIVSGTGTTRFVLTHAAPLLFALSWLQAQPPFNGTRWRLAGVDLTPVHAQLLVTATIAFDIAFTVWPRLMSTYGGF